MPPSGARCTSPTGTAAASTTSTARRYLDYNLSHGASFLGHNHPGIRKAIQQALDMGVICAYETEHHSRVAETLCRLIPCAEQVRFANSGSEATFSALRVARAVTGRHKILKFEGHFHGLHDAVVWNAHGPARDVFPTYPYVPPQVESAGVPPQLADLVLVIPWNDPAAIRQALREHGDELAAVICEPVNYNSGCICPAPGLLELLRAETAQRGILLIFDEVLSSASGWPRAARRSTTRSRPISARWPRRWPTACRWRSWPANGSSCRC